MQKYVIEARKLLALVIPVIIAQGSQTAMGVVDTIMAGSVSATDMAAIATGTSIWLPAILFGHGLILALTPVIAQLNGSRRRDKILIQVYQGTWLAAGVSCVIMLVLYNASYLINMMDNIEPLLAEKAIGYLRAIMWGAPGYLFFQVLRNQCEGLSKTKPGMVIGVIGLLINIPINYVFIYGKWGMPALGGVGCGIATAAVYWIIFFIAYWYVHQVSSQQDIYQQKLSKKPRWHTIRRLIDIGMPMALALFFEVTLFTIVALLLSPLGSVVVAGHQIALNFSSLMFVFPLSMGVATTIRIGHRLGQGSVENARLSALTSIGVGLIIAFCTATVTILFRIPIARLYNDNPEVISLASYLMLLAALYQLSDTVQVIGSGILRGYKDTRSIFYITFTAYWLLGLPLGYLLALTDILVLSMGASGFWIGFIVGLTTAAILMVLRIHWLQKQSPAWILQHAAH